MLVKYSNKAIITHDWYWYNYREQITKLTAINC